MLINQDFDGAWPTFMIQDLISPVYYVVADDLYPDLVFAAIDPAEPGRAVARGYAVPVHWTEPELPETGWDKMIQRATVDRHTGREPTMVSALEICIRPDRRGDGVSALMLAAMREAVAKRGFDTVGAVPNAPSRGCDLPVLGYG
ncbi:hypothetical protein [Micromonospora sp. RTP1Z1]|uniref:hypothetical protein n=1 Tax=Micromonospora sp. RTP1Z1 TaxID=2994043 RepID=UPI0029C6B3D6|nr:hypothetical protein [Micromonospora sp. RTP1Z1]